MKRLLPLAVALSLTATTTLAQEQIIQEEVPTTAVGTEVVIDGYTYLAIGIGVLLLVGIFSGSSGSSTTGTS